MNLDCISFSHPDQQHSYKILFMKIDSLKILEYLMLKKWGELSLVTGKQIDLFIF